LDISNNNFVNVNFLDKILESNTTLIILNISNNYFIYSNENIAQILKKNIILKTLNISNSKINIDGAIAIVNALKTNTTLTILDMRNNIVLGNSDPLIKQKEDELNKAIEDLKLINPSREILV